MKSYASHNKSVRVTESLLGNAVQRGAARLSIGDALTTRPGQQTRTPGAGKTKDETETPPRTPLSAKEAAMQNKLEEMSQMIVEAVARATYGRPLSYDDRQELIAEVISKMIERLTAENGKEIKNLKGYIATVVRNEISGMMLERSTAAVPFDHHALEAAITAGQNRYTEPEERAIAADCDRVLAELSIESQEAFVLINFEGMTHKEAARKLGISTSALRRRNEKAKELLKSRLFSDRH